MSAPTSRLHDLISLAAETSSERRRELLRGVTDMFFAGETHAAGEMALFDAVLSQLAGEMEVAVRAELAERMAQGGGAAPTNLMRNLAVDDIEVARPVLEQSGALSDEDLMRVARTKGQEHLRAISQRPTLSAAVSDAIVERGDDDTLGVLLRNEGAALSRRAQERAVDRAAHNPDLHEAVVSRDSLPIDLLNEMYFVVEARLRDHILTRNAEVNPAELEAALSAGRKRVALGDGALPADYAEAEKTVRGLIARNDVGPRTLAAMLRNRETTKFLIALAELADIDFHTARRILERKELDALAIVCKAADFDRALFLTFTVLILNRDDAAMTRAKAYGDLYNDLPREAALRTIRFWRMRRTTGDVAAA
ncbi:DUF2336 domain-containing protein [Caulobacter mirabilis]|nr:DUF2336 domain-containing protein [Caulobacter mirabilis]